MPSFCEENKWESLSPQDEDESKNNIFYTRWVVLEVKHCYKNDYMTWMVQWCNVEILKCWNGVMV